jgi:amino acid adenylation domain-containing protein
VSPPLPPAIALWETIARKPSQIAVASPAHAPLSFGALGHGIARLAMGLADRGVGPGDRVAAQLPHGPLAVAALWACWQRGAVWVPLSPALPPAARDARLAEVAPRLLLCAPSPQAPDGVSTAGVPTWHPSGWTESPAPSTPPACPLPDVGPDALAVILYTSGSRGPGKGVMLGHANLGFTAAAIARALTLTHRDRILNTLPLHHSYGLYQLWAGLACGATIVLEPPPALAPALATALERHRATVLPATPGLVRLLLALRTPPPLPALRLVTQAADALAPEDAQRLRETWPHTVLRRMYGLTECGRVSIEADDDRPAAATSVGRPLPGTAVQLVDDDGREVGPGRPGRLWVRGPHVMQGYWQRPDETARALRPTAVDHADAGGRPAGGPWLDTGDRFVQDADGCLHFHGRDDDRIKCRGERISAHEIEAVLMRHPAVAECAVVGQPHALLGERIVAHVVRHADAASQAVDAATLASHCHRWLEPLHCPQQLQFHTALPKNELGKVLVAQLRAGHR